MFRMRLLVVGLLLSLPFAANATFINNATGLTGPDFVQDFDGSGLAVGTVISNQFAGVTFSPSLVLQPTAQCGGCTGFADDFIANFFGIGDPTDITLSFGAVVSAAVFAFTDQNNIWNFEALLGGAVQDSGSLLIPFAPGAGFVGFTDVAFDSIRLYTNAVGSNFGLDTLQYNFVPEPGTLALLGIGLLGMGAARRRKV